MRIALLILSLLLLQEAKPQEPATAITNVRLLTIAKGDIEKGTIVIRGGKIEAIGAEVAVPDKATVIDGAGLVAMPGLVHAYTRYGGSQSGGSADQLAADDLNPTLDGYKAWIRAGFTTLVCYPGGGQVSGQAVAYKPRGVSREQMTFQPSAYLRLDMDANSQAKDALRQMFDAAKKAIDTKKGPKPPEAKTDEKLEPIMKFLKGELPGMMELQSPAEYLHFAQIWKTFAAPGQKLAYVGSADLYRGAEALGAKREKILMRPEFTYLPFTRTRVNAAAELTTSGCTVGLVPSDNPYDAEYHLFRVAQLVKMGWARDLALKAMTSVPAEMAGIEKRVGVLDAGKDADIVLLDSDPFTGTARIVKVLIDGVVEYQVQP